MGSVIELKQLDTPLRDPVVIAGFLIRRRAGRLAARTLSYLTEAWPVERLAKIESDGYYDLTVIRPTGHFVDESRVIDWPDPEIYVARPDGANRDVLLLVGSEPNFAWDAFVEELTAYLDGLGVKTLLTLRAFPGSVPHTRPVRVVTSTAHDDLRAQLGLTASDGRYQGPTDIGGVLGARAEALGWKVADLTVFQPYYFPRMPNAAGSIGFIEAFDRAFGTKTPLDTLRETAAAQIKAIEEGIIGSSEVRDAIDELERTYDLEAEQGPHSSTGTARQELSPDEVLEEVERLFRGPSDSQDE
jgi:predicted ATP-grasp superfamily ATP-dependent carboligase